MSILRIMTWNIHGAVGPDRRCDPERVLELVSRQSPDVLALQEVDGRAHLGRRERAFEYFAERLGPHLAEARTVRRLDRDYGHVLWSRWPLRQAKVHTLPGGGMEERAAIGAVCASPAGPLRLISTHFGLSPAARRLQAGFVAALAAGSPEPVVAMGDFNDWRLRGSVHRLVGAALPVSILPRTWPARRPLVRMDRIYASASVRVLREWTDEEARGASDHLPVLAAISLD